VAIAAIAYLSVRNGGLSAAESPGQVESSVARRLVRLAVPSNARASVSPYAQDPHMWSEAADHFMDHCALCHGRDGHGQTEIGRNMYPKTPDLAAPSVQQLSDGDLFYIIQNGVRWTGMPAWREEHSAQDTWKLVSFVRHVPSFTQQELDAIGTHDDDSAHHQPEADHHHDTVQPSTNPPRQDR